MMNKFNVVKFIYFTLDTQVLFFLRIIHELIHNQ